MKVWRTSRNVNVYQCLYLCFMLPPPLGAGPPPPHPTRQYRTDQLWNKQGGGPSTRLGTSFDSLQLNADQFSHQNMGHSVHHQQQQPQMQTLKDIILLLTNKLIWNLFLTLVLKDRTTTFEYTTWSVTLFQSRFWQENPCFEQGAQPWNLTLAKFGDNNKQVAREEHTLNKAGARCGGLDEKPGLRVRLLGGEDHLPVHKIVRVLYTANLQELHF